VSTLISKVPTVATATHKFVRTLLSKGPEQQLQCAGTLLSKELPIATVMHKYSFLLLKGPATAIGMCKYFAYKGAPSIATVVCKYSAYKGATSS